MFVCKALEYLNVLVYLTIVSFYNGFVNYRGWSSAIPFHSKNAINNQCFSLIYVRIIAISFPSRLDNTNEFHCSECSSYLRRLLDLKYFDLFGLVSQSR